MISRNTKESSCNSYSTKIYSSVLLNKWNMMITSNCQSLKLNIPHHLIITGWTQNFLFPLLRSKTSSHLELYTCTKKNRKWRSVQLRLRLRDHCSCAKLIQTHFLPFFASEFQFGPCVQQLLRQSPTCKSSTISQCWCLVNFSFCQEYSSSTQCFSRKFMNDGGSINASPREFGPFLHVEV